MRPNCALPATAMVATVFVDKHSPGDHQHEDRSASQTCTSHDKEPVIRLHYLPPHGNATGPLLCAFGTEEGFLGTDYN